jgi:FXSXX-COOH protein
MVRAISVGIGEVLMATAEADSDLAGWLPKVDDLDLNRLAGMDETVFATALRRVLDADTGENTVAAFGNYI